MSHALPTHLGARHLYPAPVADHALVANLFILPTVTLPVLRRTEDALAEKAILFRPQGAIVYRLRFYDLAVRPGLDLFW